MENDLLLLMLATVTYTKSTQKQPQAYQVALAIL